MDSAGIVYGAVVGSCECSDELSGSIATELVSSYYLFLRTFLNTEAFLNHSGFLDHIQLTHTVGLLWTSDHPAVEASTYTGQHITEKQEANIDAPSGIRNRDPSNRAAADLRLIPHGCRGLLVII
jgi:hypothetical protein